MRRSLAMWCGVLGATGVALGAFGAHGLKSALESLPDGAQRLAWWETGARYHLVHALAVGLVAVLARQVDSRLPRVAGGLFVLGVLLFSGSLYVMALTGVRALGAVTPLGGIAWIVAWTLVVLSARRLEP